jgi:hypothetical protein
MSKGYAEGQRHEAAEATFASRNKVIAREKK